MLLNTYPSYGMNNSLIVDGIDRLLPSTTMLLQDHDIVPKRQKSKEEIETPRVITYKT